jgi:hypothetical protein
MKLRILGLVGALGLSAGLLLAPVAEAGQPAHYHGGGRGYGGRAHYTARYGYGHYAYGRARYGYGYGPYRYYPYGYAYAPYPYWYGYAPYPYGYAYAPYPPHGGPHVSVGIGFGF